jgi:hypothetical protein
MPLYVATTNIYCIRANAPADIFWARNRGMSTTKIMSPKSATMRLKLDSGKRRKSAACKR